MIATGRANDAWSVFTIDDIKAREKYSVNGGPFGSKLVSNDYVPTGVPVIRGCNLPEDRRFSFDNLVFVSEDKARELQPNMARPGDLIVTQRGTLGQVGLIPTKSPFNRFVISQSQMKLTVDRNKADPAFVYYYFRMPDTVQTIRNLASSSGVPHINLDTFRKFEITLPPLAEQRRIAAILSAYDDLIENNTRRIEILEEMARSIYREWFVNFRFPGHAKVKMVDSELGPIPEGWEVKRLGDLAREVRRSVNPEQLPPETPYVGLEHLPRRSIALADWGTTDEVRSTKLAFTRGQILFGKIRPYFHKVVVAPVDGVCSSDTIVIEPKVGENFSLVLSCVSSDEFVAHATQTSQGTKMPRASWNVLVDYAVPLPDAPLRAQFNNVVTDLVMLVQNLVLKNRGLRLARDLLLPKLVSGEVDLSHHIMSGDTEWASGMSTSAHTVAI